VQVRVCTKVHVNNWKNNIDNFKSIFSPSRGEMATLLTRRRFAIQLKRNGKALHAGEITVFTHISGPAGMEHGIQTSRCKNISHK
jgi:hypothetical protein